MRGWRRALGTESRAGSGTQKSRPHNLAEEVWGNHNGSGYSNWARGRRLGWAYSDPWVLGATSKSVSVYLVTGRVSVLPTSELKV